MRSSHGRSQLSSMLDHAFTAHVAFMGRGKGRRRHIHGVPEEGPISSANEEPLGIGKLYYAIYLNT